MDLGKWTSQYAFEMCSKKTPTSHKSWTGIQPMLQFKAQFDSEIARSPIKKEKKLEQFLLASLDFF